MKDILNKVLAANADTDAVVKVIDTVVNTPRQDAQPKTDKDFTSYKYELSENYYKLAFCDEDGQVNNFGEASYDEMICK